jgi:EpsD family peptidyl-prolyl cis-trans isomerase
MHALIAHTGRLTGLVLAALLLSACGAKDDKKPATQAAARVNGAEITVHQVNQILARVSGVTEETAPRARREVLDRLVDQQLAVEQAQEKKLDRQPEVMAALEAARREVLSRAYFDQLIAAKGKPTPEEAKKYYADHPELFAQRRIYNLQELLVEKNETLQPALRDKVSAAKSMEEVVAWLKEKGVRFAAQGGVRAAEQIPLEVLPTLHQARDGQVIVGAGPQGMTIMRIASSQSAPVDEATALPRILQFLANQRNKETVEAEMKRLRETAKVEYLGDFAGTPAPAAAAKPATPPAAAGSPAATEVGNVGKAVGALK